VLSDPKKRREYDEKLKAKLHQKERIEKFDAKRKQMKEGYYLIDIYMNFKFRISNFKITNFKFQNFKFYLPKLTF